MTIKSNLSHYLAYYVFSCILCFKVNAQEPEFSGFSRLVTGATIGDDAQYAGHHDDFTFKADSLIGLQLDIDIASNLSATAQLLGTLDKHKDSGLEWLYLNYTPSSSTSIKLGQLRTSFFTYSDVLDVGYAYHWIKPPEEVYASFFFSHFDGINIQHNIVNKSFTTKIEGFYGQFEDEVSFNEFIFEPKVEDFAGLVLTTEFNALRLRAAYSRGDVSIHDEGLAPLVASLQQVNQAQAANALLLDGKMEYYQIGLSYDSLDYFIKSEWINLKHDFYLLAEGESFYISGGYQYDDFTFHLTYADRDDEYNKSLPALSLPAIPDFIPLMQGYNAVGASLAEGDQSSWTLGLRWDFKPGFAFKSEAKRIDYSSKIQTDTSLVTFALEWVF